MKFELHDMKSAPEAVKDDLAAAEKRYGAIPNLYRGFATNPATLKVYLAFNELLKEHGQLTPIEQQVVYLTVSAENGCTYCVGAHSVLSTMVSMPEEIRKELRAQRPLSDHKLNQLREFTLKVMQHRGYIPEADLDAFFSAGYDQRHLLEVITILAQKTLSNYFNHMAHTPLDEMFMPQQWVPNE
jgi:uncharacterized peroxidase-related enzyme